MNTNPPPTNPICPYCSAELEAGDSVCKTCGRWVETIGAATSTSPAQPGLKSVIPLSTAQYNRQTIKILLVIGGVFLVLLCALFAGFAWWINQQQALSTLRNTTQTAIAEIRTATGQVVATRSALTTRSALATQEAQVTQEAQELLDLRNRIEDWQELIAEKFETDTEVWFTGDSDDSWARGTWSIAGGQYQIELESLDGFSQWMWPEGSEIGTDFYLAARMSFIEGPETMDGGLIFRLQEEGQFYLFDLQADGDYSVYLHTPDEWELIIQDTPSGNWKRYEVNLLEVIGQGDQYSLILNGVKLSSFQDDRLTKGRVGIQVGMQEAGDLGSWAFDDFILRQP